MHCSLALWVLFECSNASALQLARRILDEIKHDSCYDFVFVHESIESLQHQISGVASKFPTRFLVKWSAQIHGHKQHLGYLSLMPLTNTTIVAATCDEKKI